MFRRILLYINNHSKKFVPPYFSWIIALVIIQLALRIIEGFLTSFSGSFSQGVFTQELIGGLIDTILILGLSTLFLFIPLFIISFINPKISYFIFLIVLLIYCFIQISTVWYFKETGVLLDETLYQYNFDEIILIIKNSSNLGIIQTLLLFIIATSLVTIITVFLIKKIHLKIWLLNTMIIIALICSIISLSGFSNISNFEFESDFKLNTNKTIHFIKSSIKYFTKKDIYKLNDIELKKAIQKFQSYYPNNQYTNIDFPLLKENNMNDVLSPFFNLKDTHPNFVFIIVEGLGKSTSGHHAFLGSFTPFLDSLEMHSLSWDNFLSDSERTFGALPGLLGSLPYGNKGFMELNEINPPHLTFLSIAKTWGYYSSFYYGGWKEFDKMGSFLRYNNIDYMINNFGKYKKMPKNSDNFTWGYGDLEVFNRSLEIKDSLDINAPFIDIYLTLSTHNPWKIYNQEKYLELAKKCIKSSGLAKNIKEAQLKNIDLYSCMLYSDDALRSYFNQIEKTDEFNNTIFIITGDHATHEIEKESEIGIYHVPFLIYSPLLKQSKKFKGIATYNNVTPSLLALMNHFKLKQPDQVHWLATELDTSSVFQNLQIHPFMNINRKINQAIMGNYFLKDEKVYELSDGMGTKFIKNNAIKNKITQYLESFNIVNYYVSNNKKILPIINYYANCGKTSLYKFVYDFEDPNIMINGKLCLNDKQSYSGKYSYSFNDSTEYFSLLRNFSLNKELNSLRFIFEFKYLCTDAVTNEDLPGLAINILDTNGISKGWERVPIRIQETDDGKIINNWQSVSIIKDYKCENSTIDFVIWNNRKVNSYFDDLTITILGN